MPKLTRQLLQLKAKDLDTALASFRPACSFRYCSKLDEEDTFGFPIHIKEIVAAALTKMDNAPEQRIDEDGARYVPGCIKIACEEGDLYVIAEDYRMIPGLRGITLDLGPVGFMEFTL